MIPTHRASGVPVELHLQDGEREKVRATICTVKNGVFRVASPLHIAAERALAVIHPEVRMESRVAYCKHSGDGCYQVGLIMAEDVEKRSAPRTPADLPATLRTTGPLTALAVRIKDVSVSGLGLELSAALAVGASVSVEWKGGTAVGEIRHCAKWLDGYRAGMRLHELVLGANAAVIVTFGSGAPSGTASLLRSVQQRQAKYQAIFFSL